MREEIVGAREIILISLIIKLIVYIIEKSKSCVCLRFLIKEKVDKIGKWKI